MYSLIVIDDEREIRNGFCNFFPWDEVGFEIAAQFSDAESALKWLENHTVDVVVSDINMPGMDGLQLAQRLQHRRLEVVLLSGYSEFEYARKAIELNVANYILKSDKHSEIMRVFTGIREALDKQYENASLDSLEAEVDLGYEAKIISEIQTFVQDNLKSVTLDLLSRHIHLSPYYISKFYKQKTGQNFSSYLTDLRMQRAATLLRSIDYKIYEISDMVGYSNTFNFTRTFKAYYNMTPSQYRNTALEKKT